MELTKNRELKPISISSLKKSLSLHKKVGFKFSFKAIKIAPEKKKNMGYVNIEQIILG